MFGWLKNRPVSTPMSAETAFRHADRVVSAGEGDRTVLLDPVNGAYFGLDEVGSRILQLLPDHPTADSIADRLVDEYDAPRETLRDDAARLLGELAAAKLVVRR